MSIFLTLTILMKIVYTNIEQIFIERVRTMKFTKLTKEEFESFSLSHPCGTFHQMIGWGELKARYGWTYHVVGLKKEDEIVAAALLLEKHLFGPYCLLYSPRGFLLNFEDKEILTTFTKEIKEFAKERHAIFVKIDPYVINHERDINGDIVENGINHETVITNLKKLGYHHNGYTLGMEDLQPRWTFALYLDGKSKDEVLKNMESKTRQMIRKNIKSGITTRELGHDEVETFKNIMQHTADRRNFIDRPLEYYESMIECLKDNAKIVVAELNTNDYISEMEKEIQENKDIIKQKKLDIERKKPNLNLEKTNRKIEECEKNILRLEKKLSHGKELQVNHGKKITLGGIIYMLHGNEILSLFGGAYAEFMDFLSPYTTNWNMIQYAIDHGYQKYNFYGISGDFQNKKDEMYGLYEFKRGFGGVVDEYIGEFDLIISKPLYHFYNIAFAMYGKLKSLRRR